MRFDEPIPQKWAERILAGLIVGGTILLLWLIMGWPADGAEGDVTFVGAGDIAYSGDGDAQTAILIEGLDPDAVFTTGDNAYESGSVEQFKNYYDPTWGAFKGITYPTPGNHDYRTSGAFGYFDYFGVDPYYHELLGAWHVYGLNSSISRGNGSSQVQWLKAELAANPSDCIIAMWHHPRYSSGSHGNNSSVQPFVDALATANADIILNGHDHDYERFNPSKIKGIREFVVGTGGKSLYNFRGVVSGSEKRIKAKGVLSLTLSPGAYSWQFVKVDGSVVDSGNGTC
jgi:hypothetical protein